MAAAPSIVSRTWANREIAMPHDSLLKRIRVEYLENARLKLTLAQAQRLCGVEWTLCKTMFDGLVDEKFLRVKGPRFARERGAARRTGLRSLTIGEADRKPRASGRSSPGIVLVLFGVR